MVTAARRLAGDRWVEIPATWATDPRLDRERGESSTVRSFIPFLSSDELSSWVLREDFPDDLAHRLAFRDRVATTLGPSLRPGGGGAATPD